ncbi:MAG: threonine ammonia-lyase [Anaerovoracaceae bacterium]
MLSLDQVYMANHALKGITRKTDLLYSPYFSGINQVYLKAENLQITGSFKVRGAYFKISQLTDAEKEKGVIACSAGNHAQGVALACQKKSVKATIYIPSAAPISKIEATKKYGAQVVLVDGVYDDAYNAAVLAAKEQDCVFIHPFNDEFVIAGQGTVGLEILDELNDVEAIVVPIGGGGLASGIAFAAKTLNPSIKVFGVQAKGAPSMQNSVNQNQKVPLERISTFADGIAVKEPGDLTFDLCSRYLDEVVTVTDDEIATAILSLMENHKLVAEGAGAVSVAAMMFNKIPVKNKKVVCIISGGNIDVTILSRVIQRGLVTSGRLSELIIELIDKPGQLREVSTIIAEQGANVVRVNHNHGGEHMDINGCVLKVSMETRNFEHLEKIKQALAAANYKIVE